jgi:UDP-glucose 4-epimerase
MNVFITGIAGFLGSHVAEFYLKKGHRVSGCDNLIGGEIENVKEVETLFDVSIPFSRIDCCDFEKISKIMNNVDVVYHCAASAHEGLSVFSPTAINKNTYMSTIGTLSAAIENKVKRFVFFSSMARYGDVTAPFHEDSSCNPRDPYGICKIAAEEQVKLLCNVHGVEWSIAVPHNIIGIRQKYNDPYRNVAGIMINLMLKGRQPIIYGDGKQTRCFSPIEDMLDVICCLGTEESAKEEIFNIGPDNGEITVLELAKIIHSIMVKKGLIDFEIDPVFYSDRPQEVKHAFCSSEKIRDFFNYKEKTTIEECLEKMVEYISLKESRDFEYNIKLEINNEKTPETWKKLIF